MRKQINIIPIEENSDLENQLLKAVKSRYQNWHETETETGFLSAWADKAHKYKIWWKKEKKKSDLKLFWFP